MDALTAPRPRRQAGFLPAEAPLAMPVQSLNAKAPAPKIAAPNIALRRLFVFGTAALLSAFAAYEMYQVLAVGGLTTLETTILVLFVILFAWIAFSFASTLGGVLALITRQTASLDIDPDAPLPAVTTRTALLLPTYNEPPDRVMSRVQAVTESVAQTGCGAWFDVFILSDTTDPDVFIAEEAAYLALRTRLGASNLYYRHRPKNDAKKAGNIAEWVRRFGGAYAQMIVLDADSLMTGDTLVRLVAAMEQQSESRTDPDLPRDGERHNAVRARAAVRRTALWPADRLRARLVARRRQQLLGPQRGHPHARLRGMRRAPGAERPAPDRRAYSQSRLRRGRADAARRLGGPHGARARRLVRGIAALAHRIRGARPALVPGQPAARRRAARARPALVEPAASADRHRLLHRGAAVAVVPAHRHPDFVAGAVHPSRIFPEDLHALSAVAGAGSGARRLRVRRHDGAAARAEAHRLSGDAGRRSDAARLRRRDRARSSA